MHHLVGGGARQSAAARWPILAGFISWEQRLGARAASHGRFAASCYEFLHFGIKQGWAALFGGMLLALLIATRLWYPRHAVIARYDALVIGAVLIQIVLLLLRMETWREARVILLFHLLGTVMELFKTHVGAWIYPEASVLCIGGVPLFTGFLYGAVGGYLTRAWQLFDLRFTRHPPLFALLALSTAIYGNFFIDHWGIDARYPLVQAAAMLFGRCHVGFKAWRVHRSMPLLLGFVLVSLFIWLAENIGTGAGGWLYPSQRAGWSPVPFSKLVSWFLLMLVSYTLVVATMGPAASRPGDVPASPRLRRVALAVLLIACGLCWVLVPHAVPRFWTHAIGSVLWGAMLLCLVAALRHDATAGIGAMLTSAVLAVIVELSRLLHVPPLDAFRHTMAGVLLLGRVFDPDNILRYGLGIVLAAWFCRAQDRNRIA